MRFSSLHAWTSPGTLPTTDRLDRPVGVASGPVTHAVLVCHRLLHEGIAGGDKP